MCCRDPLSFFNDTDKNDSASLFYESTPDEVGMLNSKFPNKGSPFDKIPALLFKEKSHILASIISELFNMSIKEGVSPSCLKTGHVIPIFKTGKKIRQRTIDQSQLYLSKLNFLRNQHTKE